MSYSQSNEEGHAPPEEIIASALEPPDEDRRFPLIFDEQVGADGVSFNLIALHYQGELPGDTHAVRRSLGRVVVTHGRVRVEQRPDPPLLAVGLCLLVAWALFWVSRLAGARRVFGAQE